MRESSADTFDAVDLWRRLPVMVGALLSVVIAVDILLALQPGWLDDMSRSFRDAVSMRPVASRSAHAVDATLAIGAVVISSAVLLAFMRVAASAPQLSLAPVWVCLCMWSAANIEGALPIPMPTPTFAALSALLMVGAGTLLWSGSPVRSVFGWLLLALPFLVLGTSYATAEATDAFTRDAGLFLVDLVLSAIGVGVAAFVSMRAGGQQEALGLEGVDAVDELFSQVERAERSEARVEELERQLLQVATRG